MKKDKNRMYIIGAIVVVLIASLYFTGIFSVLSENYQNNEKFHTISTDAKQYFSITPSSGKISINQPGLAYNQPQTLQTWGFPVSINAEDSVTYNSIRYSLTKYSISVGSESKTIYSPSGNDAGFNHQIKYTNGVWSVWSRSTGTWVVTDLTWATEASFKNNQLRLFADACRDSSKSSYNGQCGFSTLNAEFKPSITIDKIDLSRLRSDASYNKSVITITNNYGDVNAMLRYKIDFETGAGLKETTAVDKEVILLAGTHNYEVDSAKFLVSASKVYVEVYSIETMYFVPIGYTSSKGTLTIDEGFEYMSQWQTPTCDLSQKTSPTVSGTICYQNFDVKKLIAEGEDKSALTVGTTLIGSTTTISGTPTTTISGVTSTTIESTTTTLLPPESDKVAKITLGVVFVALLVLLYFATRKKRK